MVGYEDAKIRQARGFRLGLPDGSKALAYG